MSLSRLLPALSQDRALARLLELAVQARAHQFVDVTVAEGARPAVLAALTGPLSEGDPVVEAPVGNGSSPEQAAPVVLAVTATNRAAEDLAGALAAYLPAGAVADFPSWETLPHERLSPRSDTVGRRLAVLRRLAHPGRVGAPDGPLRIVVAPVRSLLQPIAKGLGDLAPVYLEVGGEYPLGEVVEALVAAAYTRTDLVERRGEFAVRGGVLDIFPPTHDQPLRVEFFGDEVEEIRPFKVADQRSLTAEQTGQALPTSLWAPPCREILLSDDVRARARDLADRLPGVADMLGKLAEGIAVEGMESLGPALVEGMESLLDVLPRGSVAVLLDPERVRTRAHDLVATSEEFLEASWSNAAAGNAIPVDLRGLLGQGSYHTLAQVRAYAAAHGVPWWSLSSFAHAPIDAETADGSADGAAPDGPAALAHEGDDADTLYLRTDITPVTAYRGNTEQALSDVRGWVDAQHAVVLVTAGAGLGKRVGEVLAEKQIPYRQTPDAQPEAGLVDVTSALVGHGFQSPSAGLVVLTEADLIEGSGAAASTKDMRRMPSRRRNQVDPLSLRPGDHVVHEQHGVGRFVQMMQRTVQGATREYLVLEYAPSKRGQPGDRLFVPTDQLDQVTRYVGGEAPTLNKLGGSDWAQTKSRARKHVKQIAGELIRLYSARMATSGHAFGPDTPWQRELEDAFAYIETPDQLSSIEEVKADMEKEVPMDRLICGDVGYGKTEIAVRAAFKAIQDGKQVAVLVPTTLLVQQHFQTFSERYAQFPVVVKALSRFQSDKEAKAVIDGLADGSVDLVIGTHRLLQPSVRFKNLGLVVVDEEQRFGVEHKEQLKAMRTNVDVLAMSATPIPRTLEMAVTGIREMSTLATPPEERHPVLTFVGAYDEKQIVAAIRRELLREGQVFFVHNKVSSIEKVASRIRELVPEARVATAHGKMGEHRLEQVVLDFWEKRFDVLVCTTIIETGLDISNANTLILDRADTFGLSQLHQLRGRVGRGRERAYAYFLYQPEKPMTETAHDRLATIASNTDLGAGMQVAMKDLEIRGAGNLLGGEQSGHIAGVGFDLYVRLVGEAVANYRGDGETAPVEVKIELPVDAHLPHEYVPGERLRLEAYKKLAAVQDEAELAEIRAELLDRYGPMPEPVEVLFEVARLRTLARRAGVAEIGVQGNRIRLSPVELRESQQLRLERLYKGTLVKPAIRQILVPAPKTAPVGGRPLRDREILEWAGTLLTEVLIDTPVGAR
ncbi:transcription-repair coupling factor (superfamily II helicase) [Kineosphaera limosa]|uniref:Transcription-repair-coupling factor n=1 Tax=Kineosphaera limosa NBRC 100340 TaxID=1184609 RepID=K6WPG4_9MICO|nr:transcription-repair coupling factor [Kineosphaera limosa]NYE02175.1 transcription-repair coupling factor (superfamily II helicase) [Kineosphaera limosa]GAB94027.1 transcription-repair-coupling factor [Kineosphaera limosa NBRC 100340]